MLNPFFKILSSHCSCADILFVAGPHAQKQIFSGHGIYGPRHEKTGLRCLGTTKAQTSLCNCTAQSEQCVVFHLLESIISTVTFYKQN